MLLLCIFAKPRSLLLLFDVTGSCRSSALHIIPLFQHKLYKHSIAYIQSPLSQPEPVAFLFHQIEA